MVAQSEPAFVSVNGVNKHYGQLHVLNDVDLEVRLGQVACLIGPSGSGKSTLLRCINHLEQIDGGSITVDGEHVGYRREGNVLHELSDREIAVKRSRIGMVFQNFNLFPHMTVLDNVSLAPVKVAKRSRDEVREEALLLLEKVGLRSKSEQYPRDLSGGQQQRVAIARALAMKPKLMLFDEPTSALDPELVGDVLLVMRQLALEGMTMVVVTHEMAFAREVGDIICFMEGGKVVETSAPEQFFDRPATDRVRDFLKRLRQ